MTANQTAGVDGVGLDEVLRAIAAMDAAVAADPLGVGPRMASYMATADACIAYCRSQGWRPISEAPRDGTHLWLANEHNMAVGFWSGSEKDRTPQADLWVLYYARVYGAPDSPWFTPTHFQALPAPPSD